MRISLKQIVFIILSIFILKIGVADPMRTQNEKVDRMPTSVIIR
jgi:hypothetical protein